MTELPSDESQNNNQIASNEPSQKSSNKVAQGIIFLTICIDLLGFAIVLPLLPRYGEYYHAKESTLGFLMASFSAMQFLFAPLWGRTSDIIGRRPVLLIGLFSSAICYLAFGWISTFEADETLWGLSPLIWLFISRIGAGIACATIPTAQAYIADITTGKNRAKGMALVGAAFGVGFTFGPLIGAAFVGNELNSKPSSAPGYIAGGLSFVAFFLAIFYLPETLKKNSTGSSSAHRSILDIKALKQALNQPSIALLLLLTFVTTFAFAQFESTLSLLTKSFQVAERGNFLLFAYIGFILALSQGILIRPLLPRLGEFRMSIIGVILMTLGLGGIGIISQYRSIILLYEILPLCVVGFSCLSPSLQSLLSRRTNDADQGGILGLGQSMSALARILGPVVGLSMFSNEKPWIPYVLGGIIMCGTLLFFPFIREQSGKNDNTSST